MPKPGPEAFLNWFKDQFDAESRAFDKKNGTRTRWFDLNNYEPSLPSVVEEILEAIGDPSGLCFVDLGSGKGRVVLLAAKRGFREVVGVEHKRSLHRTAERNLSRFSAQHALLAPVRLVCADALDWEPPDGPLVLFAYNPFPAVIMGLVLRRVPVGTRLYYINPLHDSAALAAGFRQFDEHMAPEQDRFWRAYLKRT